MATQREIRRHIESMRETRKITGAMYLIASGKLRRAKSELDRTRPYFEAILTEVKRAFRTLRSVGRAESRYFYPEDAEKKLNGTWGYLVITADKGLAGSYNQAVLKKTAAVLAEHQNARLYVAGDYGRQLLKSARMPVDETFCYATDDPNLHRAREMAHLLHEKYLNGEFQKLYVIYTDFAGGLAGEPVVTRLLPLHFANLGISENERAVTEPFLFFPDVNAVLQNAMPSYVTGFVYSALVDSFCCEQSARMAAMDSASRNADKMLTELNRAYNQERQNAITQEITEVAAGARYQAAQKKAKEVRERAE